MIGTNFFQSLGLVKKSIILSLSRQMLVLLPMLYVLPLFIGTDGIWLSFPVSDLISTILTVIFLRRLFKKFNRLHDGDTARSLDD
jgi:Na+-driven multidrug efflux pump